MRGISPSLYLRQVFTVGANQPVAGQTMTLRIRYDDGFVAYLNGVEVARRNLGPPHLFVYADQPVFTSVTNHVEEMLEWSADLSQLRPGANVLAFQVHTQWPTYDSYYAPHPFDETLYLDAELRVKGSPALRFVSATNEWRYFVGWVEPSGGFYDPALGQDRPPRGGFHDWVELHNTGHETVALRGWSLTDDAQDPAKWQFPDIQLPGGGYLVVMCSGLNRRAPEAGYLHTNFSLDADGEYLGLYDDQGQLRSAFVGGLPPASPFHSYGRAPESGNHAYLANPTPGSTNVGPTCEGILDAPAFHPQPGFYDEDVTVTLSGSAPEVIIRYTLDGSEPTPTQSILHTRPIALSSSRTVRARAFREGWIPSEISTGTYLVRAPAALQSLPMINLGADPGRALYSPEGVLASQGGEYVEDGLWVPVDAEDYNMALMRGRAFERPVSIEILLPAGRSGYAQADCGLRFAGSPWTRPRMRLNDLEAGPWNGGPARKPSLALFFRGSLGTQRFRLPLFPGSPVDSFDSLRLRAGKNDWDNPFINDEWVRRLGVAMGHLQSHGTLGNLFVNGGFKGYYNLVERLREPFFQSHYGSTNHWDIVSIDELVEGEAQKWIEDMTFIYRTSLADPAHYAEAAGRFDLVNFVDYLVLNAYAATWDWPQNNYYAARERRAGARWRFHVWDAEVTFGHFNHKPLDFNTIKVDLQNLSASWNWPMEVIPVLFRALAANPEFRLLFADRLQRHLFNSGALTAPRVQAAFADLKRELDPTMILLRGVPVVAEHVPRWTSQRPVILLDHCRQAGLWPETQAPVLSHPGGVVPAGFALNLANPNSEGVIYHTLDGTDPRAPGGAAAGRPVTGPITLGASTKVMARILDGQAWSPLTEAVFEVPAPSRLVITEINYEPTAYENIPCQSFEFVEIQNVGSGTADLTAVSLSQGIHYEFPPGATLAPGKFAVLVADATAFAKRYPQVSIAGVFTGKLDNAGERLTVSLHGTNVLASVRYDNQTPWPEAAAGQGASLQLIAPALPPDSPTSWIAADPTPGQSHEASPVLPPTTGLRLSIATSWAGNTATALVLRWQGKTPLGCVIEQSRTLSPAAWLELTNVPPLAEEDAFELRVPASDTSWFFRARLTR
jgi:hypothetical protein